MTIMQGDIIKIDKKKLKEDKLPTKVVIRHLPPTMTLESFIEQTDPPTYDFISHIAPDKTLLPHIYSRAYINFCDMEDLFIFTQKFDGYVFLDSKGHEYPAIVEFAPFQRIPKQKSSSKRKDVKSGTIETDQYFTDFQEKVLEEREKAGTKSFKQHYFETTTENEEKHKITDTPLLQYLRNKNAEKEKKFREGKKVRKKTDEWRKMREDQSVRQNKKIEQDYNMMYGGGGANYSSVNSKEGRRRRRNQKGEEQKEFASLKNTDSRSKQSTCNNAAAKGSQIDKNTKSTETKKDEKKILKKEDNIQEFKDPAIIEIRTGASSVSGGGTGGNQSKQCNTPSTINKSINNKHSSNAANDKRNKLKDEDNKNKYNNKTFDKERDRRQHNKNSNTNYETKQKFTNDEFKKQKETFDKMKTNKFDSGRKFDDKKDINKKMDVNKKGNENHSSTNKKSNESDIKKTINIKKDTRKENDKIIEKKNNSKDITLGGDNDVNKVDKTKSVISKNKDVLSKETLVRRKSLEGDAKPGEKHISSVRRNSLDSGDKEANNNDDKDPRTERRIRNKDRPAMAIYRPGMGRFSKQRLEKGKVGSSTDLDSHSASPSPTHNIKQVSS